jgi:D-sedoheptulose 7-phosphate isomerase
MNFHEYVTEIHDNLCEILQSDIDTSIRLIRNAHKVIIIGNGGSAAIASHMQNDLVKACGIRAMCFYDTPLLTAMSNDHGYNDAYYRQIDLWGDSGDVLVAISSSGQSQSILWPVARSKVLGVKVITLSGFKEDNPLCTKGDVNFYIPSCDYGYVEMTHSIITHYITDRLKP